MLKLEPLALELLEYKIQDVKAARQVKGGLASVWDLYNHLFKEASVLAPSDRIRVEEAGKILRRYGETSKTPKVMTQTLEALILGDIGMTVSPRVSLEVAMTEEAPILEMDPEVLEEQTVLQRLAKRVWWHDMEAVVHEFAVQCRAEKERTTARLLYALSRNLGRYLQTAPPLDLNLNQFEVVDIVPERGDPLVSFNDLEILSEFIRELVEIIVGLGEETGRYAPLEVPRGQALGFVKRMALAIARDPYSGESSPVVQRRPSSDQLRLALQELAKESLREEQMQLQRNTLTERLRITTAYERQQREVFQQDIHNFTAAVHSFFSRLERYLPGRIGGEALEPQLLGGVLFAVNPALRVNTVATGSTSVTVHLKGPTRFALAGVDIAVTGSPLPSLYINGQDHRLQPRLRLSVDGATIVAIHESNYLHLSVRDETRSLAALTAEALAVYYVLSSPRRADLLRVLRAAANVATGEPQDLVTQALGRLRELSGRAPDRRQALTGLVSGSARAVGVHLSSPVIADLVEWFLQAMTVSAADLQKLLAGTAGAEVSVHRLGDDPLPLNLGGQPVTVRKYRNRDKDAAESVALTLPDRTVGSFKTHLVQALPGGTLLCVRAAEELVCLYFGGVALEA
ncbi:hypothetical protein BH24DEI2_BH24DEI2_08530 [soil metagenome]